MKAVETTATVTADGKPVEARMDIACSTSGRTICNCSLSKLATQADLVAIRDRVLSGLKLGKQAPGYKTAQKALDRFISEMWLR